MGDKNTLLNNCACVRIRMDSHCSMMNNIHTTTESCNSKSYTALLTADAYWLYFAVLLLWIVSFTTVFIWFSLLVKEKKIFFNEDSLRAIVGLLEPTGIRLAFYLTLFFYGSRHAFGSLALSIILRFIY